MVEMNDCYPPQGLIPLNNNNNNNNNLFLMSRPSQHTKLVYETPLFVGK